MPRLFSVSGEVVLTHRRVMLRPRPRDRKVRRVRQGRQAGRCFALRARSRRNTRPARCISPGIVGLAVAEIPKLMPLRRRIALIAHDNCKREMLEWSRFNRETLATHALHATGTTGVLLSHELGLTVDRFLSGRWEVTSRSARQSRRGESTSWSSFGIRSCHSPMTLMSRRCCGSPCFACPHRVQSSDCRLRPVKPADRGPVSDGGRRVGMRSMPRLRSDPARRAHVELGSHGRGVL